MQIKNRQHMLVIVAAAGVALLVADRLVITPLKDKWKERAARIVELRKAVIQARNCGTASGRSGTDGTA